MRLKCKLTVITNGLSSSAPGGASPVHRILLYEWYYNIGFALKPSPSGFSSASPSGITLGS